jgi:cytochrome c oxidase subunit 4
MSGHISPKTTYYAIFGALMVLTAVTVAVAYQPLGVFNFPVAIGIAITKATLVILFFTRVQKRFLLQNHCLIHPQSDNHVAGLFV